MLKRDQQLIELFKRIAQAHFVTDYSSIDFIYPPHFTWDKFNNNKFIKNRFSPGNYSLYVHFPFCQSKCKFCRQFSLATKNKKLYQGYINLLIKEFSLYADKINLSSFTNIYFGGGTPTLFPLNKLFQAFQPYLDGSLGQINVESTPESLNYQKLKQLKGAGINRLLIGIQSLDPRVLKMINRPQQRAHFKKIYNFAKKIGIPVINLELVAGLPGQTQKSFLKDLEDIIELKPESIHIYGYMNSPTTLFYRQNYQRNQKEKGLQEEMMMKGQKMLSDANYFFQGDDYCLNNKSASRNLSLSRPGYPSGLKTLGQISLGLSSIGALSLRNSHSLRTINTIDYKEYKKRILKGKFPIEKEFLLNRDEKKRASLIKGYRYGSLKIKNEEILKRPYSSALNFLKRQGKIRTRQRGQNIEIIFSPNESIVFSKAFYSPRVLKKCEEIIKKKYSNTDSLDLSF